MFCFVCWFASLVTPRSLERTLSRCCPLHSTEPAQSIGRLVALETAAGKPPAVLSSLAFNVKTLLGSPGASSSPHLAATAAHSAPSSSPASAPASSSPPPSISSAACATGSTVLRALAAGALAAASHVLPMPTRPSPAVWAQKSTMLAAQTLLLAATAEGVSSSPMEGFDERRVREVCAPLYSVMGMQLRADFVAPVHVVCSHLAA